MPLSLMTRLQSYAQESKTTLPLFLHASSLTGAGALFVLGVMSLKQRLSMLLR